MRSGIELPNRVMDIKEVAEILNLKVTTVREYVADKKLTPCKNIGALKFLPAEIQEFIGAEPEKFSPFVVRKLERDLKEKDKEIENLKNEILYQNEKIAKIKRMLEG